MARPPKWDSRVPATLVPDGAAPRTQESHPSTLGGLGAHIERFDSRVPLDATPPGWPPPYDRTSGPCTATTCAPSVLGGSGLGPDTPYSSSLPAIVYTEASLARRATDPGNSSEATAAWVARRRRACACVS